MSVHHFKIRFHNGRWVWHCSNCNETIAMSKDEQKVYAK